MVTVYLHSVDGRVLFCVKVPLPMPQTVSFGGDVFAWSVLNHQYQQVSPFVAQAAEKKQDENGQQPRPEPPPF